MKYFVKFYTYDLDCPKDGWGSKRKIRTAIIEGESPEQVLKDLEKKIQVLKDLEKKIFDDYYGLGYVDDIHEIN